MPCVPADPCPTRWLAPSRRTRSAAQTEQEQEVTTPCWRATCQDAPKKLGIATANGNETHLANHRLQACLAGPRQPALTGPLQQRARTTAEADSTTAAHLQ